jgi:hypothetical protein
MKVVNTELQDLPEIFRWFDASVAYQQQRGYPDWANYDQDAVRKNIEEKNSFKVVNENDVGIVFSVSYNDPVIWREMAGDNCGLGSSAEQKVYPHGYVGR